MESNQSETKRDIKNLFISKEKTSTQIKKKILKSYEYAHKRKGERLIISSILLGFVLSSCKEAEFIVLPLPLIVNSTISPSINTIETIFTSTPKLTETPIITNTPIPFNTATPKLSVIPEFSLDPRIFITNIDSKYPVNIDNALIEQTKDMFTKGVRSIELEISPNVCKQKKYQTDKWCDDNLNSAKEYLDIPDFKEVLDMKWKNIFLTVYPLSSDPLSTFDWQEMDQNSQELLYIEYYDFFKTLLERNKDNNKKFIIQTPNEMDFEMLRTYDNADKKEPTEISIKNAIIFWNTIQSALDSAKLDTNIKGHIYHSCEFYYVQKASIYKRKAAINTVVPNTHCDLYGISSYESLYQNDQAFEDAINYVKSQVPEMSKIKDFGKNNIYISEAGFPSNMPWRYKEHYDSKNPEDKIIAEKNRIKLAMNRIKTALVKLKMPFMNLWQWGDNEYLDSTDFKKGYAGYGLMDPNNKQTELLNQILTNYIIKN